MKKEQCFLLNILSDHIAGRSSNIKEDVDWEMIAETAHVHQVDGIVYYQCKSFVPTELKTRFMDNVRACFYYYGNRKKVLENLKSVFDKQGIMFFTIKGIEVSKYYPLPALRTMGDIDIVVHVEDKKRVGKELKNLGFKYISEYSGKEQRYFYQGMYFDLHDHLIYDEDISIDKHKVFFNDCWQYVSEGTIDPGFHFLFLLVHLRKHLMNRGAGLRMFLDLAVMVQNEKNLNWLWIENELRALDLLEFARVCFGLIDTWFGVKAPITYTELEEDFADCITEKIFANGIFGYDCESNNYNGIVNRLRVHKGPRWLRRLSVIRENAFPGYHYLCVGEPYKFLKGHPLRLPAAWMYRFYLFARGKTPGGKEILNNYFIGNDEIVAREEELRRWGLLSNDANTVKYQHSK